MIAPARAMALQFRASIRASASHRVDFIIGNVGTALQATAGSVTYLIIFTAAEAVAGWSTPQWILILGIVATARGLWNVFFSGVLDLAPMIRSGQFDAIVLMPPPSLLLISFSRVNVDLWGESAVGVALIVVAFVSGAVHFSAVSIAVACTAVVCGVGIYAALYTLVESIAFWQFDNNALRTIFERIDEFAKIPLDVLPRWLRFVLVTALPVGAIGYLPGAFLTERASWVYFAGSVTATVGALALAVGVFSLGERRYVGGGG